MKTSACWLLFVAVAIGLSYVFWGPLWHGGGFVGGDIYSYFLPQKQFLAERLQAGEIPLWHNRTGFGYPLVAESQTGVFYPVHLALYSYLEVNTAYNVSHILHYVLAYVFMALFARRLQFGFWASLLAATVYVYSWFPPRCSLEWAITGGAWFPLALWCVESFVVCRKNGHRQWRFLAALSATLSVQMLAGHFCLAFITQLTTLGYGIARLWFVQTNAVSSRTESAPTGGTTSFETRGAVLASIVLLLCAVGISFGIAAMQLVPTWELKQLSQRNSVTEEHDPGYGHIPPPYLTQVFASWWYWYTPEIQAAQPIGQLKWLTLSSRTNTTEAHLYFGLLPLFLAGSSVLIRRGQPSHAGLRTTWFVLAASAVLYSTGLLIGITRHLPGFNFFEGLGRFGIVASMAVAVLSGLSLQAFLRRRHMATCGFVGLVIVGLTCWDLFTVARQTAVSVMVPTPPIAYLSASPVRQFLQKETHPVRLFAPGPNLPNLLGTAAAPVYLGLGPAEYFDQKTRFPGSSGVSDAALPEQDFSTQQLSWLRDGGITHVLSFSEIKSTAMERKLAAVDPFLNSAWGRGRNDMVFLYSVSQNEQSQPARFLLSGTTGRVTQTHSAANSVSIDVETADAGTVIWSDLYFPGWTARVDGKSVPVKKHGMFRSVPVPAGRHEVTWRYRPRSVYWGLTTSGLSIVLLLVIFGVRKRRFRKLSNSN